MQIMQNTVFIVSLYVLRFAIVVFCENSTADCGLGYYNDNGICSECGITKVDSNVRIVGGSNAVRGRWPALVLIIQKAYIPELGETFKVQCSGTLINRNTVLTASHCLATEIDYNGIQYKITTNNKYRTWPSMFTVYIGAYDISFIESNQRPDSTVIVSGVTNVIRHEAFNNVDFRNDIALIKLAKRVTPNAYINIACLPTSSYSFPRSNQEVATAGWGSTKEGGASSNILKNVKFVVYDPDYCQFVATNEDKNWNAQICAGDFDGGKDSCQGDSGGGLMVQEIINGKKKDIVAGIVSYGEGCARLYQPGIYTRTSYYIDWIKANIDSNTPFSSQKSRILNSCILTKTIIILFLMVMLV